VLLNFIESLGPILPRDRCLQSIIGIKGNLGNLKAPIMKDRPHSHRLGSGPLLALGSAFLFGVSTPIAKLLLGVTDPLLLGLLYLGSDIGLALATVAGRSLGVVRPEAPLHARDLPWLGAIVSFGGILGPTPLMSGLTLTPASSGALLLNTDGLATMAIAWLVFREKSIAASSWGRWRSSPARYCSPGRKTEAPARHSLTGAVR
jgi:hypothetical protein